MESADISFQRKKFYKKTWFKVVLIIFIVIALIGGALAWKTGAVLNKISLNGGFLESIARSMPGTENNLKGEKDGRINILLLGMRGENVPGGGLLSDTIMVVSIKPSENKAAIVSVPRDLYVNNPGWKNKTKINAVYAAGEENGKKQGISDMEKVVGEISGMPIHYGISINFKGFVDLVDALGGIELNLSEPFMESIQFQEPHVCDPKVFTVPTGKYEIKKNKNGRVVAKYPLCTNKDVECGGNFSLPAGKNVLDGKKTLCYVRSRFSSSDFERAKRQQVVLQQIKEKALSIGTLTDFNKISAILDALGNNVRTDMEPWEMQRFLTIYQKMANPDLRQRVLENTEEGMLYAPPETGEAGYILLPRGDNYDRIHDLFRNIFELPSQSDIRPK